MLAINKMRIIYLIIIVNTIINKSIGEEITNNNNNNDNDNYIEVPLLNDLKDVEILTYFLLSNNYNKDIINTKLFNFDQQSSLPSFNDSLNEMKLRQFISDLKKNKISTNERKVRPFICSEHQNEINYYLNLSSSSSLSTSPPSSSSSPPQTYGNQLSSFNCAKYEKLWDISLKCQSSQNLIDILQTRVKHYVNDVKIKQNTTDLITFNKALVRLCPLLLFQLNDQSCTSSREKSVQERLRPSLGAVWGFAILFVTIISFCSLVGVAIMPFLNKNSYLNVLNLFEGLAVGSLVGSAIFHLIPQAFDLIGQVSSQDYLWKALLIFAGIYLFFISERVMKIMVDIRKQRKLKEIDNFTSVTDNCEPKLLDIINNDKQLHSNALNKKETIKHKLNESDSDLNEETIVFNKNVQSINIYNNKSNEHCNSNNCIKVNSNHTNAGVDNGLIESINQQHNHAHMVMQGDSPIATVAWMIIFGDGFHNFIDGLSIGAAFSESILSGISISVAVICEEFPHELGDFAVLIASGMTTRQAVGYNFLSACTCYLGMIFGIIVGDFTQGSTYIFAFAGGMFLYIALVDMMSELTSGLDEALKTSKAQMFKILFLQNLGMLLGVCILFLLARYSEHINFEGLAPPTSFLS